MNHLTQKAQSALNYAMETAREMGHTYIGSEHLLLGLCSTQDSIAAHLLEARGIRAEKIRDAIVLTTGIGTRSKVNANDMTPRVQKIIEASALEAIKYGQSRVGTEHLLMALLRENAGVALHLLEETGISPDDIRRDVSQFLSVSGKAQSAGYTAKEHTDYNERGMAKKQTLLESYAQDLTALAKRGMIDPMIGRDREITRLIQILSRRGKNNPCLVGEPGVGKTAVVEGLAAMIARGEMPEHLRSIRILSLDISSLLAGAKYRGEFEERFKGVLAEVKGHRDIVLFIDEIHMLVGAGAAEGAIDAANMIKPALARGEIRLIGATTHAEYRRYIEKDAALERRFQALEVLPPKRDECIEILRGLREQYQSFHGIAISDEAICAAVDLSIRYLPEKHLPDKAIDLLDEGCAMLRIRVMEEPESLTLCREQLKEAETDKENAIIRQDFEQAALLRDRCLTLRESENQARVRWERECEEKRPILTAAEIAQLLSVKTGVPISVGEDAEKERLLHLEERLAAAVIGQEEAIRTLCRAILRNRTGMRDPDRPIGSFLFAGSSGVGKTELCRVLAKELFDTEDALIRLDMSEYTERHSISRLIGSPPGYVGFEEGGQLTERVRRRPYSVVLLDEIEKAHEDIYHLLLQILEDGVLTDSLGHKVDFKNCIVILTSNVGEAQASTAYRSGFSAQSLKEATDQHRQELRRRALQSTFTPELLNRLDAIVWFATLDEEHLLKITALLAERSAKRLAQMGIDLIIEESAQRAIARDAGSANTGARPLRRTLGDRIENMLAAKYLSGEIRRGDHVRVIFEEDEYRCRIHRENEQGLFPLSSD